MVTPGARWPSSTTPVDAVDTLLDYAARNIHLIFDFADADECVDPSRVIALDKSTGELVDLPLEEAGDDQATLTLNLEAGDALLFKYANQIPFAKADW